MDASRATIENLNYQTSLFACLSNVFWDTPRTEAISALKAVLAEADGSAGHKEILVCIDHLDDAKYKEIAIDYAKLFCGFSPMAPFPYESIFLGEQRLLMQAPCIEVQRVYAENGYAPDPDDGNEPADHITNEFRYLAFLLRSAAEALEQGNAQAAEECLAQKGRFAAEHLQLWIPSFCREIREKSSTDFFRAFSLLLEQVVADLA